ncbi:MAG: hypothetical protein IPL28_04285 [Chloroflexi bacterium]|nr:hypothetical protein [Chloroflexota bacterium]
MGRPCFCPHFSAGLYHGRGGGGVNGRARRDFGAVSQRESGRFRDWEITTRQGWYNPAHYTLFWRFSFFLNRLPDAEGYASFLNLVQNHHISVDYLANLFLESAELQHLQAERDKPVLVQLPQNYKLYVRLIDHFVGKSIADSKLYEPHVTRALEELLKPEMLFLDIGEYRLLLHVSWGAGWPKDGCCF